MTEKPEGAVEAWLRGWQHVEPRPGDSEAAASAHAQVHALDWVAKELRLDDEPWRLRVVLAERAAR